MKSEIEDLLKEHVSAREIAEKMGISEPTVYVIKTRLKNEGVLD